MTAEPTGGLEKLTMFLAVWGAIVATIALTWNIVRDWTDAPRIKVRAFIGRMMPSPDDQDYLCVFAINVGRYPITISSWGGRFKRARGEVPRAFIVNPQRAGEFPHILQVGEEKQLITSDLSGFKKELENIHVNDATGKEWKLDKKMFRQVVKDAKEALRRADQ